MTSPVYDPGSGELLSPDSDDAFVVDTEEKAEWVGNVILEAVSNLAAIEAKRKIYNEQLDAQAGEQKAIIRNMEWKYGKQIENVAKALLEANGGKKKTWHFDNMSVGSRSIPARLKCVNDDEAMLWADDNLPLAITAKTVVSLNKAALYKHFEDKQDFLPDFIKKSEASESSIINVGGYKIVIGGNNNVSESTEDEGTVEDCPNGAVQ